jgi:hypothetical protein
MYFTVFAKAYRECRNGSLSPFLSKCLANLEASHSKLIGYGYTLPLSHIEISIGVLTFRSHALSRNLSTDPSRHEAFVEIEEVQPSDSTANDMGWDSGSKNNLHHIVGHNELVSRCGIACNHNNFLPYNLERKLLSTPRALCQLSCLCRRIVASRVMASYCGNRVLCSGDHHRSKSSIRLAIEDTYLETHEQRNLVTKTAQFLDDLSPGTQLHLELRTTFAVRLLLASIMFVGSILYKFSFVQVDKVDLVNLTGVNPPMPMGCDASGNCGGLSTNIIDTIGNDNSFTSFNLTPKAEANSSTMFYTQVSGPSPVNLAHQLTDGDLYLCTPSYYPRNTTTSNASD